MEFTGLPAAKTVEAAILLAQLQILRRMEKRRLEGSVLGGNDGQEGHPMMRKSAQSNAPQPQCEDRETEEWWDKS